MADRVEVEIIGIDKLSGTLSSLGQSLQGFGRRLTTFVTLPIIGAGVGAIRAAADFEQTTVAFTTMLGGAEEARDMLQDLAQFAARTPFELTDVEMGARQLLAMGSSAEEIIPELKMLGDVSAGLNVPIERLILNYGQVRTQNKLTGRELRDFLIAGVPLVEMLAEQFGVTKDEIADMVSAGEVGFDDVQLAFQNMTSEGGKFFDLMDAQSQTTAGQFSNLKDSVNLLARDIGALLLPMANELITMFAMLTDRFASLSPEMQKNILIAAGVAAALGPVIFIVGSLISALGAIIPVIGAVVGILTGPVGLAIAAVVAAVLLLKAAWENNFLGIRDIVADIWAALQPTFQAIRDALGIIIPAAISILRQAWEGILLPAIQRAQIFFQAHVLPLLQSLGRLLGTVLKLAATVLAGVWQNVLLPAIRKVWEFVDTRLMPVVVRVANFFRNAFEPAVRGIGRAFDWVRGLIDRVTSALGNIRLPAWLTPGSPTPFEMGLRGINKELGNLARSKLPSLQTGLGGFGSGNLVMAGAGGGTSASVVLNYNPMVSFADQSELENRIIPLIENSVKRVIEQSRL